MSMGKTTVVQVAGRTVVCRELTVAELRAAIATELKADVIDGFLFEEASLTDIQTMTDLTAEQIGELRPSDLRLVLDGCKKANPDFFAMAARLSQQAAK